jgi:dienelactone hydrolase
MRAVLSACVILLVLAAIGDKAAAERAAPPLWGDLKPGPHAVGYRVVYAFDRSRTWQVGQDRLGRPVRISVWYPAAAKGRPMRIADYIHNIAPQRFAIAEADLEQRDKRVTLEWAPPSAGNDLMQAELTASRNARSASGQFPLLLYSSGTNPYTEANVVMAEYLASHGFMVATVDSLGQDSAHPEQDTNNAELETDARDLEFAWSFLRTEPNVDKGSLGTFGHSLGGVIALMIAMQNSDVAAVAGLDGSYGFSDERGMLTSSYRYAPTNMHAALLDIRRVADGVNLSIPESLDHADRYFISLPDMFHGDFTSFVMGAAAFHENPPPQAKPGWTQDIGSRGYQFVCQAVLDFFEAKLKGDPRAAEKLDSDLRDSAVASGKHLSQQ